MKERRYSILVKACWVLFCLFWLVGSPLYGQDVIRRQGKSADKSTSTKSKRTERTVTQDSYSYRPKATKAPKSNPKEKVAPSDAPKAKSRPVIEDDYDYVIADSVAVDEIVADSVAIAEENSPKSITMASGFEMYGRIEKDYVDYAIAQKSVREALQASKNAKTGCLTDEKAMFVYGGNGYTSNGIPSNMLAAMKYCNENKYTITDVAFNDKGLWCVVYNGNKYKGNMPDECKKALDSYIAQGDDILSVSFSDKGNYAIVTEGHFNASDTFDYRKMQQAVERFGHIYSVCISNRGIMVTCSRGILFWDVPEKVINSLKAKNITPRVVRYTDSGTYMAFDVSGANAYYM